MLIISILTFKEFGLDESLIEGIEASGYENATPVQEQVIPLILNGQDIIASAQTGTGKTAAFLIALFNRLLTDPGAPNRPQNAPRAIVIGDLSDREKIVAALGA